MAREGNCADVQIEMLDLENDGLWMSPKNINFIAKSALKRHYATSQIYAK